MDMLAKLTRWIEAESASFLDDLAMMVNTDCGTGYKAGVDTIGRLMQARLVAIGCNVEVVPDRTYGDHLIARLLGRGRGRVLLLAHMDTVYPLGTPQSRPFAITGARAYGPGVHDMKAGLLSGYYALRSLVEAGFDAFEELTFLLNSEEEVGSPSSRPLIEAEARHADAALVFEGAKNGGKVVTARKGVGRYELAVAGRAAHSGVEPEAGRSAILELAHKIVALHNLADQSAGTILTVTTVQGGVAVNVVPPSAGADIDLRVPSQAEAARLEDAFRRLEGTRVVPDTTTAIRGGLNRPPMEKGPGVRYLFDLASAIAAKLGFALEDMSTGGGSDGNFTAALGVPTLDGLGADGGGGHSEREYVELASIVPRTALVAGLIHAIVSTPPDRAGRVDE